MILISDGNYGHDVVHVVNTSTGLEVASISTDLSISGLSDDIDIDRIFLTGQLDPKSGIGAPYLVSLSATTSTLLEEKFIGVNDSAYVSAPIIDSCRHIIYTIMSVRAQTTVLNAYDAVTLERLPDRGAALQVPMSTREIVGAAVDDFRDRVVIASSNDDATSGSQASVRDARKPGSVPLPSAGPVAIDERTGIVYVAGEPVRRPAGGTTSQIGTLMAVDLGSKQIIAERDLGHGPHSVALDQQSSRIFATNGADRTVVAIDGVQSSEDVPEPRCVPDDTNPKS
jgi:hypothetical protein